MNQLRHIAIFAVCLFAPPVHADGVIVLDDKGGYAFSYNQQNLQTAEEKAMEDCRKLTKYERHCSVADAFGPGHGAVATSRNRAVGYSHSRETREEAEAEAITACERFGGKKCKITDSFEDTTYEELESEAPEAETESREGAE